MVTNKSPKKASSFEAEEWCRQGLASGEGGLFDIALACFDIAIKIDPEFPGSWYWKGVSLAKLGRLEEAVNSYEKAIELDPEYARAWYSKGNALMKLGKVNEAHESYDQSLKLDPSYPGAWFRKGCLLGGLGKAEEALKHFDKAVELGPISSEVWHFRAEALRQLGRFEDALESENRAIKLNPRYLDAWLRRGFYLTKFGLKDKALESFEDALKIDARSAEAWHGKGIVLEALNKLELALYCNTRALEIDPKFVRALASKGAVLHSLGRFDESLKCFEKAVEADARDALAWWGKGLALESLGKLEEALDCLKRSAGIDPQNARIWNSKGVALQKLGKIKNALECYEKAVEIDSTLSDVWMNHGTVLHNLNRFEEELRSYEKALDLDPGAKIVWYNKGVALMSLGRNKEALECFRKTIEIDPAFTWAWNNQGACLDRAGRKKEAIKSFEKAIELDPDYQTPKTNLGNIHLSLGNYSEGLRIFSDAEARFSQTDDKSGALKFRAHRIKTQGLISWSENKPDEASLTLKSAQKIFLLIGMEVEANSSELLLNLIPIDKLIMKTMNSANLLELKKNSVSLNLAFTILSKSFSEKAIRTVAFEILRSKGTCSKALCRSLTSHPSLYGLRKAKTNLKKLGFSSSVVAINSLENFILNLGLALVSYKNLDNIPENVGKALIMHLNLSALDGLLSRSIAAGSYADSILEARQVKVIPIVLSETKERTVRVCCVQIGFKLVFLQPPQEFGYILADKNAVKAKVFSALRIAEAHEANIVCFPELSTDPTWVKEVKRKHPNMVVIFGSYYKDGHNISPVIIRGKDYYVQKVNPSPIETPTCEGRGMISGKDIKVFHTEFGRLAVLICRDFEQEINTVLRSVDEQVKNLDFVFVPERNKAVKLYQETGEVFCQQGSCPFIVQVNVSSIESEKIGGTCVIGMENRDLLKKYIDEGTKPNDSIEYKLIEAKEGDGLFIVELDISQKGIKWPVKPKLKLVGFSQLP